MEPILAPKTHQIPTGPPVASPQMSSALSWIAPLKSFYDVIEPACSDQLNKVKEISIEDFRRLAVSATLSRTGQESLATLKSLNPGRPILLEKANRGLQMALSRRIKKTRLNVDMRVSKRGDGKRDIVLLLQKK